MFRASDMILHNNSDTAYLVASEARSRAAGFTFGINSNNKQILNGHISIITKRVKNVISSAAQAEIGALVMNATEILPFRVNRQLLCAPTTTQQNKLSMEPLKRGKIN